jgi:hypothetical protein
LDNSITYIKDKLSGNFNQINDFISFCKYHNLHHWYSNIEQLSLEQKNVLAQDFQLKKLHSLLLLDEWNKIKKHSNNKVSIHLIKGISLSNQIFNDPLLRPTRDIDLWVDFDDIFICDFIFKEIGYKRIKPEFDLNFKQLKYIHNHIHHFTYINDKNVIIELHWQLFTPKSLFNNGENIFKELPNNELTLYPIEWLLHYLIIHGSMHHWFKLFWLYDVHTIISLKKIDWDIFFKQAKQFKDYRMINSSFYLVNNIFGTEIPYEFRLNNVEKRIVDYSLKSIVKHQNYLLLEGLGRTKRSYYLSLLKPGFEYKLKTWFAPFTTLEDWKTVKLPAGLFWLYYVLRPFIWLYNNYLKK